MQNVIVLGTGMAGFGATYRLHAEGITPVMYDKNSYHGRPHGIVPSRRAMGGSDGNHPLPASPWTMTEVYIPPAVLQARQILNPA